MSDSLRSLSDYEILSRTEALVASERKLTLSILLHLNEVERRKLHLKRAYPSMFVYCTRGLGYSASAASRRIRTARCIRYFPKVLSLLQTNQVNLSTVSRVSKILNTTNADALFGRICGKSQREVETIVAEFAPLEALPRETVRTVVVRVPVNSNDLVSTPAGGPASHGTGGLLLQAPPTHTNEYDRNGRGAQASNPSPGSSAATPVATRLEHRALIQFSARPDLMSKLERIRSIASHRLPINASFEELVEFLADYFNEREDPAVRRERREKRKAVSQDASDRANRDVAHAGSRGVPARVRDEVFIRDQGRCAYVGANGRRCGSTHVLQVDHIKPVARGGASTPDNLRLLCAHHNRLEAERLMGRSGPRDGPMH